MKKHVFRENYMKYEHELRVHIRPRTYTTHSVVIRKLKPLFKFPTQIEMAFSQILAIK